MNKLSFDKLREDNFKSTVYTAHYSPCEWERKPSENDSCYGKLDGIRRRITKGYTVLTGSLQRKVSKLIN